MISGLRHRASRSRAGRSSRPRRSRSTVRGHSALTAMPSRAELLGHAEHAHAHAELRHRVGDVRREPPRLHVERRREVEDVRVAPRAASRCGRHACEQQNVPRVLTPSIRSKRFIGVCERAGQADRARVVDEDVDAAERLDGAASTAAATCSSSRMSQRERQRLAAGLLDLRRPPCRSCRAASGAARRSSPRSRRSRRRARRAARSRGRCRATRR